jgi:hypothetical protein
MKRQPRLFLRHPGQSGIVVIHLWAWQQRTIARMEAALADREPSFPQWSVDLDPDAEGSAVGSTPGSLKLTTISSVAGVSAVARRIPSSARHQ